MRQESIYFLQQCNQWNTCQWCINLGFKVYVHKKSLLAIGLMVQKAVYILSLICHRKGIIT